MYRKCRINVPNRLLVLLGARTSKQLLDHVGLRMLTGLLKLLSRHLLQHGPDSRHPPKRDELSYRRRDQHNTLLQRWRVKEPLEQVRVLIFARVALGSSAWVLSVLKNCREGEEQPEC